MSWAATSYVKKLRVAPNGEAITKGEKLVLFVLADYHHEEKGHVWASLSHLAEESLHSRRGVILTLQALRDKGVLSIYRPSGSKTNHYRFTELDTLGNRTNEAPSPPLVNSVHQKSEVTSPAQVKPVHPIFPDYLSSDLSKDIGAGHPPDTGVRSVPKKRSPEQPKGEATYRAYADGYVKRYRVEPVRNAKTNALLCQLVDRLGAEEAPLVAAFYVSLNAPLYVKAGHPPNLLVRDCESLRTQLKTGPIRAPMVGPKAFQSTPTVNRETVECPPEAAAALSKILGRDAFSFSADHKGPTNSYTAETAVGRVPDRTERLASVQAENEVACG
ncbi:MAG: hypothetical protein OJF51_002408 [Nitrospira sp.]|jgi:hypothetical protein|nr:MAG: hypothetical protein OJF51_002408 [Nitrospira sp.]